MSFSKLQVKSVQIDGDQYSLIQLVDFLLPKQIRTGLEELVCDVEDLYPGIDLWYRRKIVPGIANKERQVYLLLRGEKLVAEAIVKRGIDSKLCSLRVAPFFQGKSIGPYLFSCVAHGLEKSVKQIHFTAPESLVLERKTLFQNLGFFEAGITDSIYRRGEDELAFRANPLLFKRRVNTLLRKSMEKCLDPSNGMKSIVLSVHPKFATQIMESRKKVELRRRFSQDLVGTTVFIYATRPTKAVLGQAVISSVVEGRPYDIWNTFGDSLGCTKAEYWSYCKESHKVSALMLEDAKSFSSPLPWPVFQERYKASSRPPLSYQFV